MGIATEAGTRCSKASRTQFDTGRTTPDPAGAGHGAAFGDDQRLVLRLLELIKCCKYRHSHPHDDTLCSEFCAAHRARTHDSTDSKPRVSSNCFSKLCVAAWCQAGIGSVRP